MSRITVRAYSPWSELIAASEVAEDGSYLLTTRTGGTFLVQFVVGSELPVLGEWWDDRNSESEATPIVVADGGAVTGIDPTLELHGTISGKITRPAGIRGEMYVRAYLGPGQPRGTARIQTDGSYTVSGLAQGTYKLQFGSFQMPIVEQWWTGKTDYASADPIVLGPGENATGYDVTIVAAATISGRITYPSGVRPGESNVSIDLYTLDGVHHPATDLVDGDGRYRIINLAPGTYKMHIGGSVLRVLPEWWDDKPDFESAQTITVVAGEKRTGVNATLAKAPTILGKVTLPPGVNLSDGRVQVRLSRAGDGAGVAATTVAPDGTYSFGRLDPIAYKVQFVATGLPVLDEWWQDQPDSASATPITLGVGEDRVIDATLAPSASISGKVSIPSGLGTTAAGVTVTAHSALDAVARTTTTSADGSYTLYGLPEGAYRVRFASETLPVAPEWWKNSSDYASATPIAVHARQARTGVNAYLDRPSSISGRVTLPAGVTFTEGQVRAEAFTPGQELAAQADVRTDGTYTLPALTAGTYRVRFRTEGLPVAYEWWNDRQGFATASKIVLAARQDRQNVNAVLAAGASLSGTVTLPPGVTLDQGRVDVAVFTADDAVSPAGTASVRPDGTYTVLGLRAATVKIRFTTCGLPAADEWWNNKSDFASALTLTTLDGREKKNVNVMLAAASGSRPC